MHSAPFFVCIALALVEVALLVAAPGLLATLAFIPLSYERRIRLPPAIETDDPRYRDSAMARPVPELPKSAIGRVDLNDAVLVQSGDGRSFALRRAFTLGPRRMLYLVRITMELEGGEVVLRAKQAILPITAPLFALGIGLGIGDGGEASAWSIDGFFVAFAVLVFGVQWLGAPPIAAGAVAEALGVIEYDLRRTFPRSSEAQEAQG